jgi:NADH-quinone oxidoreductase subunit C
VAGLSNEKMDLIKKILGTDLIMAFESSGCSFLRIRASSVVRVATILHTNSKLLFDMLIDGFAIDMLKQAYKFEIYYNLFSTSLTEYIFIVTEIARNELATSLSVVFENATWYEREMFDMFGIAFRFNTDMRRILTNNDSNEFQLLKGET